MPMLLSTGPRAVAAGRSDVDALALNVPDVTLARIKSVTLARIPDVTLVYVLTKLGFVWF